MTAPVRALIPALAVLAAGICLALQAPTNARLAAGSGSILFASLVSFTIGTAILLAIWLAAGRAIPNAMAGTPAWAWLGGFYGAVYVAVMAYAVPGLGVASALALAIAAQLVAALAIDGVGLFGLDLRPLSWARAAGISLVIAGVVLARR